MKSSGVAMQKVDESRTDVKTPPPTSRIIHRKILIRLFLGWLFLCATIGCVVLWLEINRIQQSVHELALSESEAFSMESSVKMGRLDSSARHHLVELAQKLIDQHFLVVELYDHNKQLMFEAIRSGQELAEHGIDRYRHRFPLQGEFSHELHFIQDKLLLVILVPLKSPQDALSGYFEGIYQVDRQTLTIIKDDLLRSLLFVTISITFTTLLMYPIVLMLNRGLIKLSGDLLKGNLELMNVLGCAIAERDSDTNSHNYRVTFYALRLGEAIGLSRENIHDLIAGAFLHDVGKIGIRDSILLKPEKLTPDEFEIMKTHVTLGVEILSKSTWFGGARDVVECHHEKFDGSGYLQGLKGEAIPLNARIFAIVDVFDALTSKRPYKEPWMVDAAIATLNQGRGSHFDPQLLSTFEVIAPRLYQEMNGFEEDQLEAKLQDLIADYFLVNAIDSQHHLPD
jgi:HD-GYP domain-containing protein (c-di-GMP phosphodiesterase class II)